MMKNGDMVTINLPGSKFIGMQALIVGTKSCRCCFHLRLRDGDHFVEEGQYLVEHTPDEEGRKEAVGV